MVGQIRQLSPLFALASVGRVHSNRALKKLQGRPKFLRKFDEPGAEPVVHPLRCVQGAGGGGWEMRTERRCSAHVPCHWHAATPCAVFAALTRHVVSCHCCRWVPKPVEVPATGYLAPQGNVPSDIPFEVRLTPSEHLCCCCAMATRCADAWCRGDVL